MDKFKIPVSAEFFPPKTEEGARQILRAANAVKGFPLDMVSITYGAGGSSRERTLEYGELLREIFNFDVMPHLTCVGHSVAELKEILARFRERGFDRVMALRGDPPRDSASFAPHPDGLAHASDLVSLVKSEYPEMRVACAGYPEKHPEAASLDEDIDMLRRKVDCGAGMIITQLFFDNRVFFDFVQKCRSRGVNVPIQAGVMPALSLRQLRNFSAMCGCVIPEKLAEKLAAAGGDDAQMAVGIEWAKNQISGLMENGVDGVHLYILNRVRPAIALLDFIGGKGA